LGEAGWSKKEFVSEEFGGEKPCPVKLKVITCPFHLMMNRDSCRRAEICPAKGGGRETRAWAEGDGLAAKRQ